jgi:hypothetical protein
LVSGVASSGSRLFRSFSPTKVSRAMTSEKDIGKKPTIRSMKGTMRSLTTAAPNCSVNRNNTRAVKVARAGKTSVRMTIGKMMRQSRKESRTSRRVTSRAIWRS